MGLVEQQQSSDGRRTELEFDDGLKIEFELHQIEEIVINFKDYSVSLGHLYLKKGQYYFKHSSEVMVDLKTDHLSVAKKMTMAVSMNIMSITYETLHRMVNNDERKQASQFQLSNRLDLE